MTNTWYAPSVNFSSTTLNGSINDSVQTITLNSTTGLKAPGYVIIDRQDNNTPAANTPNAREVVSYTGVSGNDLTGCVRGADGSTARSHSDGALVETTLTVGMWNDLQGFLAVSLMTTNGTLRPISTSTITNLTNTNFLSSNATIANLTLTTNLTVNSTGGTAAGQLGYDTTNKAIFIGDGAEKQSIYSSAWTAFTPSWTNLNVGNGTNVGVCSQVGKAVNFYVKATLGASGATVSGLISLAMPVTAKRGGFQPIAKAVLVDTGTGRSYGHLNADGELLVEVTSGTYLTVATTSSTVPHTWAATDYIEMYGTYEAA